MKPKLHLLLCDLYEPEVRALRTRFGEDVTFGLFDDRCRNPPLEWPEAAGLVPAGCQGKILGSAACLRKLKAGGPAPPGAEVHTLEQCMHLVVPRGLVETEEKDGAYCVTPGWVARWETHLARWGFDHETAAAFFAESARRIVLCDTVGDERGLSDVAAFAAAVRLPHSVIPVGLGHAEESIGRIVSAWRASERRPPATEPNASPAIQADYALALDLLGTIFRNSRSEADAVGGILEAVQMLFGPRAVRHLSIQGADPGRVRTPASRESREPTNAELDRFALCVGEYAMVPNEAGFVFRIGFEDHATGIVDVEGVHSRRDVQSNVNLALAIAPVCATVVESARAHEEARCAREALELGNARLVKANSDLEAARAELRTIQEVLPVCAWCSKILDEEGAWSRLSKYLAAYAGAPFTHGICGSCTEGLLEGRTPLPERLP